MIGAGAKEEMFSEYSHGIRKLTAIQNGSIIKIKNTDFFIKKC